MSQETDRKQALKQARADRALYIQAAAAASKSQKQNMKLIRQALAEKPLTPPEIAKAAGLAPARTMWLLAAMRKYGALLEGDKAGDYFTYQLAPAGDEPEAAN